MSHRNQAAQRLVDAYLRIGIVARTAVGERGIDRFADVQCQCRATRSYRLTKDFTPEFLDQKFAEFGWSRGGRNWECPTCIDKRKERTKMTAVSGPARPFTDLQPQPSATRAPTVPETLRISDLLAQHFDKRSGLYAGDWTDDKIARQLNLPRAMVAYVRDHGYGPLKAPTEMLNLKAEVASLQTMVGELAKRVNDAIDKYKP